MEYRDFGEGEREKSRILEWLRRERTCLLSSEEEMCDTAEREGIRVIRLADVGPAAREVVLPGDKVTVKIQKKGRTPHRVWVSCPTEQWWSLMTPATVWGRMSPFWPIPPSEPAAAP